MLEDTFWEEDIWEYKSKRKPKPAHPSNCSENISESVEKAADGKYQPKRKGTRERTTGDQRGSRGHKVSPGETDSRVSVGSSQNPSCGDESQQSQSKETTPRKHCRAHRSKQVSPRTRPVYEGHCPSCQMPFSSLLGQTPRWHVFECLDSPPVSDTDCPEGLLCTSTIPSHYKKYTHLLLAQSRASNEPAPSQVSAGSLTTAEPASCKLEESQSEHLKTENLRKVLDDSLLTVQCLRASQPPAEASRKLPFPACPQRSLAPQCAESVKKEKLRGGGWPLAEDTVKSQSNSQGPSLPLPENDLSSREISYSPLQSDEETYDEDQELDDSQQELFFTQRSEDSSLGDGSAVPEELHDPFPKEPGGARPSVKSRAAQATFGGLGKGGALNDSFQLLSHTESRLAQDDPPHTGSGFFLFSPASAGGSQISMPLLTKAMAKPLEKERGEGLSLRPTQSQMEGLQGKGLGANSTCACRKVGKSPSTPLARSLSSSPTSPKGTASQPSKKVLKQLDIGVFFGLPPKRQEETPPRKGALERPKVSPLLSPSAKRSRPCKRKAEDSPGDLEFDGRHSNESQHPRELSGERTRQPRKRQRKSSSQAQNQKSGPLSNSAELGPAGLSRGPASVRGTHSRPRRGYTSEPAGAGKWRRTCPFYKRIPGTGFTVDAFQYGEVEGCTAYFLTHFHSDHYAGLSKDFAMPVYCTEITGNLLKRKLRVQEQYIHQLPMDTECMVDGVRVILLDANHCPGAAMILFHLPNGAVVLHTGDFRADPSMERSLLAGRKVHTLYLDTTYCSPEYTFPSQQEVVRFAINTAFEAVTLNPRVLVVCGTYSLGKEKVFLAIADVLGSKVGMTQEKYKTLQCLNIPEVSSLITTDMCNSLVHLLPMSQINFKGLQSHLKKCAGKYDQILAFRPTGWTHSSNITSIADIAPQKKGNISIYGIPYSEHSSYLEMKRFVQWLKPQRIIPTVNVGSARARSTMEKYFKEWKLEAGY